MTRFKIGARVELRHEVERFPHFVVAAGEQGTVSYNHQDEHGGTIAVRMDNPIDGADEWNNEVQWNTCLPTGIKEPRCVKGRWKFLDLDAMVASDLMHLGDKQ